MQSGQVFVSDIINSVVASNAVIMKKFDLESQFFLVTVSGKTLKAIVQNIGIAHESDYDPLIGRKLFWKKRFGMKPLPRETIDAAIKFAGSRITDMHITDEDVQSAIDAADNA